MAALVSEYCTYIKSKDSSFENTRALNVAVLYLSLMSLAFEMLTSFKLHTLICSIWSDNLDGISITSDLLSELQDISEKCVSWYCRVGFLGRSKLWILQPEPKPYWNDRISEVMFKIVTWDRTAVHLTSWQYTTSSRFSVLTFSFYS